MEKLVRCKYWKEHGVCNHKNCKFAHQQLHFNRAPSVFSKLQFKKFTFGCIDGHLKEPKQKVIIKKTIL